ncbi:MAG: outer membrane beta-barrel protein [Myxococcota bacterium]
MSSPKNALSGASLALAALLACAALPARAGDKTVLKPMLDVEQGWDSNIFNKSEQDEGSLVTRISPSLWLENTGELGNARLGLTGIARNVWEESDLSGIDGLASGEFDRRVTPRLTLFGNGYLEHYSGYNEIDPDGLNQGDQPIVAEQPAWKRDLIGGGFRYLLSERLSFTTAGSAGRVNYESIDSPTASDGYYRDRTLLSGRSSLSYQLTALDQVSLNVKYDDTTFQNLGAGTNDSAIWKAEAGWSRNWTQAWTTSASIGVSSLDAVQKGVPQTAGFAYVDTCFISIGGLQIPFPCPQSGIALLGPADFSSSSTAVVGALMVRRLFQRGSLEFMYTRDTRTTAGSGKTNFNTDSFTLAWQQRLAERVRLTLTGNYTLDRSATDKIPNYAARVTSTATGTITAFCGRGGALTLAAPVVNPANPEELLPTFQCGGGSSEEDRQHTTLSGRLEWQLRKTLSSYAVARYYHSITDQTRGNFGDIRTEDLDKFTVGVGFRYYHDLGL